MSDKLPVAIIGGGPSGLAAAAHLLERGLTPMVFERGPAAAALRDWAHVRMFSPWRYNIDDAARRLLEPGGWRAPDVDALPTGGEMVALYLEPLAQHPALASHIHFRAEVTAISRLGIDKITDAGRAGAPFTVHWRDAEGTPHRDLASAVIDTSGTWTRPNPIGVDGLSVPGESAASAFIAYGIPDVLNRERDAYRGRRTLVIGGGHSAINVVLDLLRLRNDAPETKIGWALRRDRIDRLLGGGLNDALPARGALGTAARRAIEDGSVELFAPFAVEHLQATPTGLRVSAIIGSEPAVYEFDRIIVATGFRPDLSICRELRVGLDPAIEAPILLAPMIDPNLHSCGTVPPHGAAELTHPEPGFYIAGSKSYGRAPTFLLMTGYEQIRSIVAEIAGDHEAARQVRLVLPETGVCNTGLAGGGEASSCCGGPAPVAVDACCAADADAKAAGEAGCGCAPASPPPPEAEAGRGCCGRSA